MLKKRLLLITIVYAIALATVCLVNLNSVPDVGVSFGDKIFHGLTYFVLAVLCYATLFFQFSMVHIRAITYATIVSIIFGIIIEVLQGVLTTSRESDIFDVFANSVGAIVAAIVLLLKNRITVKKQ